MPALDLNNPNNVYLVQSGFNVQDIEKSPTLVNLLNRFQGNLLIDERDTTVGVGAKAYGNTIHIAKSYKNFLNIAHELGHATGQYQQINRDKDNLYQFDTPQAYGMARAKAEGEATYYEFLVAKELGYQRFVKPLWPDNAAKPQDKDVFTEVDEIMRQAISENDKITQLAVLNQSMLPSGQLHAPLYTYDEYNTLVFLNNRFAISRISQDYQQAFGKPLDWNSYEAKSLANKANQYFGTLVNDVLINHHIDGSVLGQQGVGDLLWGSQGDDVLVGNSGQDRLLGGADDDTLIGNAGDDVLVGGTGNDLYYFTKGFGHDTIINVGGGKDTLYLADRGYDELSLVTQEKQDLTLDFATTSPNNNENNDKPTDDQLTIKDFYLGGDNASLAIGFAKSGIANPAMLMPVSQLTSQLTNFGSVGQRDMSDYQPVLQKSLLQLGKVNPTATNDK